MCRLAKKEKKTKQKKQQQQKQQQKKDQKETKTNTHKRSKIFRKNPEAVKWISGKQTIVYFRCTCHRHTLVFGIRKAWPPPTGAREIDGLPKAFMAELLVTKPDPNSCDRVG